MKALFHAMTTDGRTFTARKRIPTEGQANHPQLAIDANGVLAVTWDESGTRHQAPRLGHRTSGRVWSGPLRQVAGASRGWYLSGDRISQSRFMAPSVDVWSTGVF